MRQCEMKEERGWVREGRKTLRIDLKESSVTETIHLLLLLNSYRFV